MRRRDIAWGAWLAILGCRFDSSKLDGVCASDDDCSAGAACVDGRCAGGGGGSLAELCGGPGVLFCEDFEDGLSPDWIENGGETELAPGAAAAGEGTQVLELRTHEGQETSSLLYVLGAGVDEAWVRFDIQYAEDFQGWDSSIGPALGGSSEPPWGMLGVAGRHPTGEDFFLARLKPDASGAFGLEGYFESMEGILPNSLVPGDAVLPRVLPGQWRCVEMSVRLNAPGETDGEARVRVGDARVDPGAPVRWRTTAALSINTFALDSFDQVERPADSPNRVRFDNVVISTTPIGCLE